jgi:hypothetical protein
MGSAEAKPITLRTAEKPGLLLGQVPHRDQDCRSLPRT